jgi:hypothetical protein
VYKNGDVIIRTGLGPAPKAFQLHSAILSRHSPWFANAFRPLMSDDPISIWYSFTIEEVDGKIGLIRHRAEGKRPNLSHESQTGVIDDVEIKIEEASDEAPTALSSASPDMTITVRKTIPNATAALTCYSQVLGTFYSIPPQISSTKISTALVQSESLTNLATELGCLHLVRSYIGDVLSQHRQALYLAIKSDPARWIQLALALQNQSIYTECLVHMIGAHPRWSPTWPTKRTALPEEILSLVKRKSQKLDQMRTELERDLLLATLPYGQKGVPLNPADRAQTETWITVQIFRDQLAQRIDQLDRTRDSLSRGTLFRGLHKGTLPYLETDHIRSICQGTMRSDWRDLADDLKCLKEYTGLLVKELAANELMIDPDTNDVGYLTCAKIEGEDVPWLASLQNSS